jgi:hypothetical protein
MGNLRTVNERTTARYLALVVDEHGDAIDLSAADSITLTAYDVASGAVLNARNAPNVKNDNDVSVYATAQTDTVDGETVTYNLAWDMQPADSAIVGPRELEQHAAMFAVTWASTKQARHEFTWLVRNLKKAS